MKTLSRTRVAAATVLLFIPMAATLVATPASAQPRAPIQVAVAPQVERFAMRQPQRMEPGRELRFRLEGVAGGDAWLDIPGVVSKVDLAEVRPGVYEGSYTIRQRDDLGSFERAIATLQKNGVRTTARVEMRAERDWDERVARGPQVERFAMRQPLRMEPGRELRFRLEGAPGGDAWLDIPGVVRKVDLAETRPGVYEGSYTIRQRDDLDAFDRAVATLQKSGARTTARVEMRAERDWDNRWGRGDDRGPRVTDITPAPGDRVTERGRVEISARIQDNRTGVNRRSIRLLVDGQDVTRQARIEGDEIRYRDNLREGRHTAELSVRDRSGNETRRSWNFEVVDRQERVSAVPTPPAPPTPPLMLALTSHAPNASVDFRGNLRLEGQTVPHATVRVRVDSVANLGGVASVNQPVADQVVQADASGRFTLVIQPRVVPIPGARYDVRLTASEGGNQAEQRISLHQRG